MDSYGNCLIDSSLWRSAVKLTLTVISTASLWKSSFWGEQSLCCPVPHLENIPVLDTFLTVLQNCVLIKSMKFDTALKSSAKISTNPIVTSVIQ